MRKFALALVLFSAVGCGGLNSPTSSTPIPPVQAKSIDTPVTAQTVAGVATSWFSPGGFQHVEVRGNTLTFAQRQGLITSDVTDPSGIRRLEVPALVGNSYGGGSFSIRIDVFTDGTVLATLDVLTDGGIGQVFFASR